MNTFKIGLIVMVIVIALLIYHNSTKNKDKNARTPDIVVGTGSEKPLVQTKEKLSSRSYFAIPGTNIPTKNGESFFKGPDGLHYPAAVVSN